MQQRGLAAVAFTAVLLFAASLALLWSGRGLLFEQRAAANQPKQALAFNAAESGLDWARARLNDARPIDTACRPVAAGSSFRERFAAPWVTAPDAASKDGSRAGFAPPTGLRARCRIDAASIECRCPAAPGRDEAPEPAQGARFIVELRAAEHDARSLWLIARACSGAWSSCAPRDGAPAEAQAVLRERLALAIDMSSPPASLTDQAASLQHAALASVPGSWRDGHCRSEAADDACEFTH